MKKVILLVILVILVALILWWNSRKRHEIRATRPQDDTSHVEPKGSLDLREVRNAADHAQQIDFTGLRPKGSTMSPLTSSFGRRQARDFLASSAQPGLAKASLILSDDEIFLSYSVMVKQDPRPIESIHFYVGGKAVKQVSGPRTLSKDDTIIHGLWRRNDSVPFTPELAESIKKGDFSVGIKFVD
jgi:hypothetical protein